MIRAARQLICVCIVGSIALGTIESRGAEIPWPAESLSESTNLTHVEGPDPNDFYVDLSGAFWNPKTRRLWVCRNGGPGGSKFWVLKEDGNGSFEVDYRDGLRGEWTNFGDLEAITQADYNEEVVYLMIEGEERIKEFDVSTYGTAVLRNNWNTSPHLPLNGGSGAEGLVFVPDSFLSDQGFVDGSGNPYVSQNGMGGLMFVAHQNGGRLYAFDLNRTNATFTFVGAYRTNYSESCELTFDRSDGRLYILHGANWNRIEVTTLGSTLINGERHMNELFTYGRPTGSPTNWNLEGFALMPNEDCVDGKRSAFLTIDDGGAESLLWFKEFPCNCEVIDSDGDGVNDCDDACPDTPSGEAVDEDGCACSQLFLPFDSDGDGVSDCYDECPDTPFGEAVDSKGCSCLQLNPTGDADQDGVPDCLDLCPNTPFGLEVDANGCNCLQLDQGDDDGDGVPNCFDLCPDTPPGTPVSPDGCPLPVSNSGVQPTSVSDTTASPDSDPNQSLDPVSFGGSFCGAGVTPAFTLASFAFVGVCSVIRRSRQLA